MFIATKEIYIKGFGWEEIGRESDEEAAIENGEDESIFFYVPDDVFERGNKEVKAFVEENAF